MIRWAERGLPGGRNYSWPSQARTPKKKSLMPQTVMVTILISLMVVTTNRLIWRRLYRLAETPLQA